VVLLLMKLPTHFTIQSGIFLSLLLCKSWASVTLSNAQVMSCESSVATRTLFCHVAWTCCNRKLSVMSMDLPGWALMCWGGIRLYSLDSDKI
jgi:hypothetical protein